MSFKVRSKNIVGDFCEQIKRILIFNTLNTGGSGIIHFIR